MNNLADPILTADGKPQRKREGRLRVALVGCGAISEQMHLPVLAGHEGLTLSALVDRDEDRARRTADRYGVKTVLTDVDQISPADIDAVIVATPPFHHASASLGLMRRGLHVLVEKPMAIRYADAVEMVETAEQQGVILSVSLFRRLYPSLQLLRSLIDGEYFGRPLRLDLEGGSVYAWSAATLGNMKRELAGGGVLIDIGAHYFDQLVYLFPGAAEVVRYEDNSLGGIETDCAAHLRLPHRDGFVDACIKLSRSHSMRNTMIVHCERGHFELGFSERAQVQIRPNDLKLHDPKTGLPRECMLGATWSNYVDLPWYETFRAEIDDWLTAIASGEEPQLSGRSVLPSVKLIDDCYQNRQQISEPWVEHPLRICVHATGLTLQRRVLITGASGFIGCRVAEILSAREGYAVRALVHNPGNASRLARLPVEMVQGDLCDAAVLAAALEGCESVIHCAVGTTYGDDRTIFKVTVGGTKSLVKAAERAAVRRFIHLSSVAVYGDAHTQVVDENTPLKPNKGDSYSRTKLLAEQAVQSAMGRGLSAVVLRPGCVYGPFGATFTTRPLQHLKQGRLVLENCADLPSNTVFVDNLAEAIVRCLEADDSHSRIVYNIADDDGTSWGDYYGYFASAIGLELRRFDGVHQNGSSEPKRRGAIAAIGGLFTSPEFKEFAKRALVTDPVGTVPRFFIERVPGVETRLRRVMGSDRPEIYRRDSTEPGDFVWTSGRRVAVSSKRIRDALGYEPAFPRAAAMSRVLDWAKYSRVL